MPAIIILYDACILYSAPLRDLFMYLAMTDLYQAKWTNDIHDEWIKNILINRPDLTKAQLTKVRDLMNIHIRDCLVEGYQRLIPSLTLPDANDRHVLAAAIQSSSSVILTYNLKDFPQKTLDKYGIQAQHPDQFLSHLIDLYPDVVCDTIKKLRKNLKKPPVNVAEYLLILEKQILPKSVKKLEHLSDLL